MPATSLGPLLHRLAVVAGSCSGLALLVWLTALASRPDLLEPAPRTAEQLAAAAAWRDVRLQLERPPVVWREVDYSEGEAAAWWPRVEPPLLAPLVESGKLPPLVERTGPEPLVLQGVEGPGRHGGTWFRIASSEADVDVLSWRLGGANLVRWSPQGYPIVPHVARSWEVSPDRREWTIHLRRGMRWSDGHPFTARDILFWWEHDQKHFGAEPPFMRSGGRLGEIEMVDEATVRFTFPAPHAAFLEELARVTTYALPEHYLRPYHPALGDPEKIERARLAYQLPNARAVYHHLRRIRNPEHPRLWPWVPRAAESVPPYTFVRNPYYFGVDAEGRQLPYLDRIQVEVKPQNLIGLSAAQGQVTFQFRHLRYEDYTLLISQRERNGYEVYHWYPAARSAYTVFPNLNRRIDPARPETAWKHRLLNERDFRRALSLAIDRREIIRAEFNGQTEPAQLDPGPDSPFHHPRLYRSHVEHRPDEASRLLDGLGLIQRDGEGMRTFPDGSRMTFYLHTTDYTGLGPAQLLVDHWAAVGIRVVIRDQARTLWQAQQSAREHDLTVWSGDSELVPLASPRNFVPTENHSFFAPGFGRWFQAGGYFGSPATIGREVFVEPPSDHPARKAMDLLVAALGEPDEARQRELVRRMLDIAADEVWTISISSPPPQLVVVRNGLRNVPRVAVVGAVFSTPANAGVETFWLENGADSPGAIEQMRRVIDSPRIAPGVRAARGEGTDGGALGSLLRWLFLGSATVGLALAAVRHPYIARRLALMAPTLLVISIIVFTVIQLPPGDFLSARIQELEMTGDAASLQAVQDLKSLFDYDQPVIVRYVRWLGLPWFVTFAEEDRGLLQGDLGRSMENGRPVNEIVGDRILLTVLISLFSILFTWVFALPVGIYSAVRQYSVGDYVLTFLGFIGMCIPNFLLALLLIHVSAEWFGVNISGLFSPEFAAQPEWDWPKVKDLLQHIWVPVVVLATGGTAGMIRVMRGNLLDELRKPYVTTARAKGVRPLRLLLKYPVRIALNPFVSGIGGIFPALVSGGAIVAMVLSLPTVGPLMLSALLAQDMYLAGSMLMVLSALGVFGTLVSDLLLLWLDPRIRLGGGAR